MKMTDETNHDVQRDQREHTLHTLIVDVIDTVAMFDGRFSYSPMTADGVCHFSFKTLKSMYHLKLWAKCLKGNEISIDLEWSADDWQTKWESRLYGGVFDEAIVRHQVSIALADWYGKAVRNEFC